MAKWLTAERDLIGQYQQVFGTPAGQDILRDMRARFHWLHTTFDQDERLAAFNEGQRSVVLYILTRLRMTDADLMRLAGEQPVIRPMEDDTNG